MPLYEYRCNTCGKVFEKMVRWSQADESPVCPSCQSFDTQKKMSAVASFNTSSGSGSSSTSGSCGSGGRFS